MGGAISAIVFQPPEPSYPRDANLIYLSTSEREVIPAFYIDNGFKYTVLLSHGNADDLGFIMNDCHELSEQLEVNVFAYEYTGYGRSSGEASEEAFYADVEAAFQYLRDIVGVSWEQVILYGRSIGSGPSLQLALRHAVRAVILHSPFLSIYRVVFQVSFTMPGDMFPNVDRIGTVSCPVFIMHGREDEIVPFWHAQKLVKSCKPGCAYPPLYVDGAGHNDLVQVAREEVYGGLRQFMQWLETHGVSPDLQLLAASEPR